jgi:hypothetical protein
MWKNVEGCVFMMGVSLADIDLELLNVVGKWWRDLRDLELIS